VVSLAGTRTVEKPRERVGRGTARTSRLDGPVREGAHVAQMQRRRLLSAVGELALERGLRTLTVTTICARAGVSRKTFYCLFEEREEFMLAAFNDAVQQAGHAVGNAVVGEERWKDRVRMGLTALLGFLDREPGVARLLIVEALNMGEQTLNARRLVLARVTTVVEGGRTQAKAGSKSPPLTAEGVVGAVFSVIHARLLARDTRPLVELTGALMAIVVQPYLGPAAAQRELERASNITQKTPPRLPADPFKDLPMRLTYRTARVLGTIAATPGSSSKHVAETAGINDEGQTSKLLHRLARNGLIEDNGVGPTKGLPRAWSLTQRGQNILEAIKTTPNQT
jgi:AcrR family transcriptional regulator